MKTAIMKLAEITPAEYNPRKRLEPGDKEYEALKNSLERFGVAEPLVVNETTGKLVSGHQRLNVLLEMGVEEVEVVLVELDEEQEKLLNIAMNKIEGDWDYKKLEALFSEISAADIKFTGFSEGELQNLSRTAAATRISGTMNPRRTATAQRRRTGETTATIRRERSRRKSSPRRGISTSSCRSPQRNRQRSGSKAGA